MLKAIETQPINIITHINYGMPVNVDEVARLAKQKNIFIELNGKRVCFSPADMESLLKYDTMFILNSDAHTPEKVGDVRNGMRYVVKYNIPEKNIVNLGKIPTFKNLKNTSKNSYLRDFYCHVRAHFPKILNTKSMFLSFLLSNKILEKNTLIDSNFLLRKKEKKKSKIHKNGSVLYITQFRMMLYITQYFVVVFGVEKN